MRQAEALRKPPSWMSSMCQSRTTRTHQAHTIKRYPFQVMPCLCHVSRSCRLCRFLSPVTSFAVCSTIHQHQAPSYSNTEFFCNKSSSLTYHNRVRSKTEWVVLHPPPPPLPGHSCSMKLWSWTVLSYCCRTRLTILRRGRGLGSPVTS